MKKLLLGTVLALASTSAFAETCRVTDPTGTPLISVPRPMAKSLAKPKTVQLIYYTDYQNDKKKGCPWVLSFNTKGNKYIGWVYREFVSYY